MDQNNVTTSQASTPMPKYRCFKEVWALKIKDIQQSSTQPSPFNSGSYIITPEDKVFAPFEVPNDWYTRHAPQAGGYYVVYEDGYKSYSPARAFEEGYMLTTQIPQEPRDLIGKIRRALNCHSRENASDTPDFILATFLVDCLKSYETAVQARELWYGRDVSGRAPLPQTTAGQLG